MYFGNNFLTTPVGEYILSCGLSWLRHSGTEMRGQIYTKTLLISLILRFFSFTSVLLCILLRRCSSFPAASFSVQIWIIFVIVFSVAATITVLTKVDERCVFLPDSDDSEWLQEHHKSLFRVVSNANLTVHIKIRGDIPPCLFSRIQFTAATHVRWSLFWRNFIE